MGYRQYIYSVPTWLVEQIRKCKTESEFIATMQKFRNEIVEYDEFENNYYVRLHSIGDQLFEFGKHYEDSDEMYKHGDSLFSSEELRKNYQEYGAIVLDPEGIECAIEWYRQKVEGFYLDLLKEKSDDTYDDRSQFDRMKNHIRDYAYWWKGKGPGNLDKETDCIVNSWLYEHEYFELVRIYKTFDWDNDSMIFLGW